MFIFALEDLCALKTLTDVIDKPLEDRLVDTWFNLLEELVMPMLENDISPPPGSLKLEFYTYRRQFQHLKTPFAMAFCDRIESCKNALKEKGLNRPDADWDSDIAKAFKSSIKSKLESDSMTLGEDYCSDVVFTKLSVAPTPMEQTIAFEKTFLAYFSKAFKFYDVEFIMSHSTLIKESMFNF